MPFDSMPRSLRGFRLATMTTLRPTIFSGSQGFCDAGYDGARLRFADIDFEMQEFVGAFIGLPRGRSPVRRGGRPSRNLRYRFLRRTGRMLPDEGGVSISQQCWLADGFFLFESAHAVDGRLSRFGCAGRPARSCLIFCSAASIRAPRRVWRFRAILERLGHAELHPDVRQRVGEEGCSSATAMRSFAEEDPPSDVELVQKSPGSVDFAELPRSLLGR